MLKLKAVIKAIKAIPIVGDQDKKKNPEPSVSGNHKLCTLWTDWAWW